MNIKRIKPAFVLLTIFSSFIFFACDKDDDITNLVEIGITLPLTGESPLDIEAHQAALKIAIDDVNNYFKANNLEMQVQADIQDTENSPEGIASAINHFSEKGIQFIASAGVSQNLSDASSSISAFEGVMIHTTSTSTSLSVADNIFRIIPDDTRTALEIATKLESDNIADLIILYRDDVWGKELCNELQLIYEEKGLKVYPVGYEARFIPESLIQAIDMAETKYNEIKQTIPSDKIAMVVLSFNEINEILTLADEKDDLTSLKWYGSDGYMMNNHLTENSSLAQIAGKVGLYCPAIAAPENDKFKGVQTKAITQLGYTPRTNNLLIYDAVWAAAIAISNDISSPEEAIKTALSEDLYIFGTMGINESGDREDCGYDYWYIVKEGESYSWKQVE